MYHNTARTRLIRNTVVTCLAALAAWAAPASAQELLSNPYSEVDWESHGQYKANLHTHTTRSDGFLNPHEVVDLYHELGYKILALADHNQVTYPWTAFTEQPPSGQSRTRLEAGQLQTENLEYENRDPDKLGMLAIQANEFSAHHHTGSYFNGLRGTRDFEHSLRQIREADGLAVLFHPGRYDETIEWYADLYRRYDDILVGLEVYNQRDRYPGDRDIWDAILMQTMPGRPVWAFANDDMHVLGHVGHSWTMMVLQELTHEHFRASMENGTFFFAYSRRGHDGPAHPRIDAIHVDPVEGAIRIEASEHEYIVWIAAGEEVARGERFTVADMKNPTAFPYVRAVVHGPWQKVLGTQPFGIHAPVRATLRLVDEGGDVTRVNDDAILGSLDLANTTDEALTLDLTIRLNGRQLERRITLEPGETATRSYHIPAALLNQDAVLQATLEVDGFRPGLTARFPLQIGEDVLAK